MKPFLKKSHLWILLWLFGAEASSQNIAVWTLNNTLAGTGTAFNAAGAVSLGAGIPLGAFNGGVEYYGQNGWPAGGINSSSYIEFSISPNPGYELNLSGVVLRIRRSNTGSPAGSGPLSWALRSSLDGFVSDLATGGMTHNYNNYTVALSGFNALPSTVSFRLYGFSTTVSPGGNSRLVVDNISVQGAVVLLPVKLLSFTAMSAAEGGQLKWKVSDITPGTSFRVERSINGTDFHPIYETREDAASLQKEYVFFDKPGSGKCYYRIAIFENNKLIYISKILVVENKKVTQLLIERVVVQSSRLIAGLRVAERGSYRVELFAASGQRIWVGQLQLSAGTISADLNISNLIKGNYVLRISNGLDASTRQFVVLE